MIDTLKLAVHLTPDLKRMVDMRSHLLQKISPSGEVVWERSMVTDDLPSHFSGLRVWYVQAAELSRQGFKNARSLCFFEFSLSKYQNECSYNHLNYSFDDDLKAYTRWVDALNKELGTDYGYYDFEIYRVDIARNWLLYGADVEEYLRALDVRFSRNAGSEYKLQRYPGCLYYGSSWVGKKLYHKLREFMDVERKKNSAYKTLSLFGDERGGGMYLLNGRRALTNDEIQGLSNMVRFECGFKKPFLKRANVKTITDVEKIIPYFLDEEKKFITVKRLSEGLNLPDNEYKLVDLVKRLGINAAREIFLKDKSRASYFRIKKSLACKGIYLEAIVNADWRLDTEKADNLVEYELKLAA